MFAAYVNFKIRTFQWSAVRLCGGTALEKAGNEGPLLQFTASSSSSMSMVGLLSYQRTEQGHTSIAGLDSGALALSKQAPGNSCVQRLGLARVVAVSHYLSKIIPSTSCLRSICFTWCSLRSSPHTNSTSPSDLMWGISAKSWSSPSAWKLTPCNNTTCFRFVSVRFRLMIILA